MATTLGNVWDDFFAAAVTAIEGAGEGKFIKIHDGVVNAYTTERPFLSLELIAYKTARNEGGERVEVMTVKIRVGFEITDAERPGKTALKNIAIVDDFIDGYSPPAGSYGFKDREWSISARTADEPGTWGFADALIEVQANVTPGSNS